MHRDKLEELWTMQLSFNDTFFQKKLGKNTNELTMEERSSYTKNHLLSIVKETMEVLDEVPNWKEHRNERAEFIKSNLLEEIIDVNKFSMGLAQIWGMSYEEFYEEFVRKSTVVEQRWNQEQELNLIDKNSKVIGIDIDGVLGEYHSWFLTYLQKEHNLYFTDIDHVKVKVGTEVYEQLKSKYRQSDWKAKMPPRKGASELTHKLREAGYQIVVLTARPYKKYSRIYPDTLEFLRKNNIAFDAIIWDEQKHIKIIKEFPNLEFMIEDTPSIANEVAIEGYQVFMPEGPNNDMWREGIELNLNVKKVKELEEILDLVINWNK